MDKKKQNILISIISIIGVAIILLMLHIANKDKTLGEDDNTNTKILNTNQIKTFVNQIHDPSQNSCNLPNNWGTTLCC